MTAREGSERKRPGEKPGEIALARAKDAEKARLKAEEALAEVQKALAAARAKLEEERLARAKAEQTRIQAETALAEARKAIGIEPENMKGSHAEAGWEAEQRISFIVRLTVDERGQPRRTEVEHAQSGKKEFFLALDLQRLAAFMQMCISPPPIREPAILPVPSAPTKESLMPGTLGSASSLTVSEVRVFRRESPGDMASTLNPNESFLVQVRFRLYGPQALSLTVEGSSFDTRVYAHEVTTSAHTLLTSRSENLVADVLEYGLQELVPGLRPGLYRLVTMVTVKGPTNMVAHYDGPIVHVLENQPSTSLARPLHGPLAQ